MRWGGVGRVAGQVGECVGVWVFGCLGVWVFSVAAAAAAHNRRAPAAAAGAVAAPVVGHGGGALPVGPPRPAGLAPAEPTCLRGPHLLQGMLGDMHGA